MLRWLLLMGLLPQVGGSRVAARDTVYKDRHVHAEVAGTTRPHIYYCRSPNMEDFSCWWHPLENLTDGEQVTYVLRYAKEKGPTHECPDYVTSGPNSCHFDSSHTIIWKMYCMNVTAVTARGNYTSQEHCLDVAEIVQTEAPVNLTSRLADAGGDEMGHNALLSWEYPVPSDLKYGWITLVYELQYRRVTEPDNWKVKERLREPHVELLGLPVDDYVVRVRCRSQNNGLWSDWSAALQMSVPGRQPAGKLLVRVLVSGVSVVALLIIAFGIIPQSKRIKDYFLPPIPKPRIIGIDPLLLKKGNLDEINRHLSSFHSYKPPIYTEELWETVNADNVCLTAPTAYSAPAYSAPAYSAPAYSAPAYSAPAGPMAAKKDAFMAPRDVGSLAAYHQFKTQNPASCVPSLSPYCSSPPEAFAPPPDASFSWPRPEFVSLPGTEYSMMGHPGLANAFPAPAANANEPPQNFYTCVQLMNESGEVHLVPCLPPAFCQELPRMELDAGVKEEKKKKLAEYQGRMKDGREAQRSEAADPLLPVDKQG